MRIFAGFAVAMALIAVSPPRAEAQIDPQVRFLFLKEKADYVDRVVRELDSAKNRYCPQRSYLVYCSVDFNEVEQYGYRVSQDVHAKMAVASTSDDYPEAAAAVEAFKDKIRALATKYPDVE